MGKTRVERHVRNGNIVEEHDRTVGGRTKRPTSASSQAQATAAKQALENAEAETVEQRHDPRCECDRCRRRRGKAPLPRPETINSHELVAGHRVRVSNFPYSEIAEVAGIGTDGSGDVRIHFEDKSRHPVPRTTGVFKPVEVYPEGFVDPMYPYTSESGVAVDVPQRCVEMLTEIENEIRGEPTSGDDRRAMMLEIINGGLDAVNRMSYSRHYHGINNDPIEGTVGVPNYEWTQEQHEAHEAQQKKFANLSSAWKMHAEQVAFMAIRARRRAEPGSTA